MLRKTQGSRLHAWSGAGNILPETRTLISRFTTPPSLARTILINQTIASLITSGVWAKLDLLYFMAQYDSQAALQNWISNTSNMTAVSSPTFTVDRGFTTNGTSSYLDFNFNPSTGTHLYTQNSASFGVYSNTAGQQAGVDIGAPNGSGVLGRARNASDQVQVRINDGTTSTAGTNTDATGLYSFVRPNSASKRVYRNTTQIGADIAVASTVLPIGMAIGQFGGANFTARQYQMGFAGAALTAGDVANLHAATSTYLAALA